MRSIVVSVVIAAFLALVGAVVVVGVIGAGSGSSPNARGTVIEPQQDLASQGLYAEFYIPEFELTDQDAQPVDESILDGRVTVVDFFFTDCPLACPPMNAQMQRIQEATAGEPVRLLSISVSGSRDTPDVLTAYAEKLDADPKRWRFLTGDEAYVTELVREGLRFDVARDDSFEIDLGDGDTMFNIQHPTRLLLIGPDRHVIDMADYLSSEGVSRLIERAKAEAAP